MSEPASVKTPRRFYLLKRQEAAALCDKGLELVWHGKQLAEPGTALPASFPFIAELEAAGYVAVEDLDGADACEVESIGLTAPETDLVMAALAELQAT